MSEWQINAEAVPSGHPCLPGHFPGNPIVPGTLILERVIEALQQQKRNYRVSDVVSAKFLSPLLPQQPFSIHFREQGTRIDFECRRDDLLLSNGRLQLEPSEPER